MEYFIFAGEDSRKYNIKIEDVIRPFLPEKRDHYEMIPGRHGSVRFEQPYGDRSIKVICTVKSSSVTERTRLTRDIPAWFHRAGESTLIFQDEADVFYTGTVTEISDPENIVFNKRIEINFQCQSFKTGRNATREAFTMRPDDPRVLYVKGTAETAPTVTITATEADIINPQITINDQTLFYTGTILKNTSIDINFESFAANKSMDRDIMMTGAYDDEENNILENIDGEFGLLKPGSNAILYSSFNESPANIAIIWNDKYI